MKITVCFNSVRVIVPCGNGELSIQELTHRAVARYKKATNKHPEDFVRVQVLETIEERAILDPDDVVGDVLDDKDKVVAIFEEQSTVNSPPNNIGDGMSTSSVGTASPDIFQSEHTNEDTKTSPMLIKDENHNNTAPSKLIVVSSHINEKLPPPPVAPKPKGYKKKEPSVPIDSVPSEDSGICVNTWNRVGSDSSKSEVSETLSTPRVIRTAETAFVAIGTPVLVDKQFNFNGINNENKKNMESQNDFEEDDDDDDGTFSLGRNSARQSSMFLDNPVLDRWAELQEQKVLENQGKSEIVAGEREEPAGASLSPTEERTFESNVFEHDEKDGLSNGSICSGESDDMFTINLNPSTPGDLGFKVTGYKTADGREVGLIVKEISADGCAAKDERLQVADRIVEINDNNLLDLSNERAEEIFSQESQSPFVKLVVSGAHSFIHEKSQNEPEQDHLQVTEPIEIPETSQQQNSISPEPNGIEPPPGFRDTLNRKSLPNGPQLSTNVKTINKRFLIELNKGSDGLGFSITTRDNPAGGHTPIFVKNILAKGAAIEDGQLQSGDQIVEVNGTEMSGKSQGEAVNILRSTRGLVKLLIQREEITQEPIKPAVEVNEESTKFLREEGKQVLTFKIPLSYSGAAGLGISVKGKMEDELPQDKGIYVKSVIAGGAAQKDGRLQPDDQLLSVNNVSFLGVSNSEAIEKLRTAMQTTRLGQAFIEVTIARYKDSESDSVHELQVHQPEHERPIEASLQANVQNHIPETEVQQNVPDAPTEDLPSNSVEGSQEDDDFNDEPPIPLNFSMTKSRNPVLRNESYCFAIRGPYQQRPLRPSHFVREPERSPGSLRKSVSENFQDRPSSTVGVPTPPLSSTNDVPSSANKGRNSTPIPPPRLDSFNNATMANLHIHKHVSSSNTNGKYVLNQKQSSDSQMVPPSPSEPIVIVKEPGNSRPSNSRPPPYEQAVERIRNRSAASSEDGREVFLDGQDVMLDNTDALNENPFAREGFGRQSMSEKRARASVDAKKTQIYLKREKQRESKEKKKEKEKIRPSSDHVLMNGIATPTLRKAKSEGHMQANAITAGTNSLPLPSKQMWKSTSESSLKSSEGDGRKASTSNLSFRNAMEGPFVAVRDAPNGVTRPSQSEDQDEIPITMTSKADFNAVQQKLTKKPFYKKFKLGKTRRGEYNLTDSEGSPKHSLYGQEALIDFPSAEQRYRQLVSHYDEDSSNKSNSLPNRRRKDQIDGNQSLEQPSNVKIGRVIMSEPTRV